MAAAEVWRLEENAAMELSREEGAHLVRVHHGTVLVTQAGDREDHVLEAGQELLLRPRGRAVAWAFTEAAISMVAPRTSRAPRAARVRRASVS